MVGNIHFLIIEYSQGITTGRHYQQMQTQRTPPPTLESSSRPSLSPLSLRTIGVLTSVWFSIQLLGASTGDPSRSDLLSFMLPVCDSLGTVITHLPLRDNLLYVLRLFGRLMTLTNFHAIRLTYSNVRISGVVRRPYGK